MIIKKTNKIIIINSDRNIIKLNRKKNNRK